MTKADNKPNRSGIGGRPSGVACSTFVKSGAYATKQQLPNILKFWKKYSPGRYRRTQELITKYLRLLKWDTEHPRLNEVRDLCIRTVSRAELLMIIIERQYTRNVYDKKTGHLVKMRPAEQIQVMEQLDIEIQGRLLKLGIFKIKGNK